jgi:hypothetical protein
MTEIADSVEGPLQDGKCMKRLVIPSGKISVVGESSLARWIVDNCGASLNASLKPTS